jgi:phosphotriesterase-related protein
MGLTLARLSGLSSERATVQTVTGPLPASQLGVTLMHEHIVTDLRAPAQRGVGDYNPEAAFRVALPHLNELREAGCRSLVEITPIHIGRDAAVLRRLSEASGLNIVAATGIYGAAEGKFIPAYAHRETAEQLAERYIREAREGISATGVRPGIIKTGVNKRTPLPALEKKLVRAAALAHKATGLTVASHTGPGLPAFAQLDILAAMDVPFSSFVWVHAQNEQDHAMHYKAARAGAWVEFDGLSAKTLDWHLTCVRAMAEAGLLTRTLVSHDAGWYRPGEPGGGRYRDYTLLFREFLPRLRQSGFSDADIDQLLVKNPRAALA